jgi:hypothetical protein
MMTTPIPWYCSANRLALLNRGVSNLVRQPVEALRVTLLTILGRRQPLRRGGLMVCVTDGSPAKLWLVGVDGRSYRTKQRGGQSGVIFLVGCLREIAATRTTAALQC